MRTACTWLWALMVRSLPLNWMLLPPLPFEKPCTEEGRHALCMQACTGEAGLMHAVGEIAQV